MIWLKNPRIGKISLFLAFFILSNSVYAIELKFPSGSFVTLDINVNNTIWNRVGTTISPTDAGDSLQIPSLASLSCIGTDGSGNFQAGTCSGASAAVLFTYANITSFLGGTGSNNSLLRAPNVTTTKWGNATWADNTSGVHCSGVNGASYNVCTGDGNSGGAINLSLQSKLANNTPINVDGLNVTSTAYNQSDNDGNIFSNGTGNFKNLTGGFARITGTKCSGSQVVQDIDAGGVAGCVTPASSTGITAVSNVTNGTGTLNLSNLNTQTINGTNLIAYLNNVTDNNQIANSAGYITSAGTSQFNSTGRRIFTNESNANLSLGPSGLTGATINLSGFDGNAYFAGTIYSEGLEVNKSINWDQSWSVSYSAIGYDKDNFTLNWQDHNTNYINDSTLSNRPSFNATRINSTSHLTTNLFDYDGSDFFDESGCGVSATATSIDQTGAITCQSIAIAISQITDIANFNLSIFSKINENINANFSAYNTTLNARLDNTFVNSSELELNLTKNSTNLDIEINAGDNAINLTLSNKINNNTEILARNYINITGSNGQNSTLYLNNSKIWNNGSGICIFRC